MHKFKYFRNCTCFPTSGPQYEGLVSMIDESVEITRRTFLKHVDREDLDFIAEQLSYFKHPKQGLTMAGDWHVSYHKSKYRGRTAYYFVHSRIEYIFIRKFDEHFRG